MAVATEGPRHGAFVISEARGYRSREQQLSAIRLGGTPAGEIYDANGNFLATGTLNGAARILLRPDPPGTVANIKALLARDAEVNDAYLVYVLNTGTAMTPVQIATVNAALFTNSRIVVRQGVLPTSQVATAGGFIDGFGAFVGQALTAAGEFAAAAANLLLAVILPGRRPRE